MDLKNATVEIQLSVTLIINIEVILLTGVAHVNACECD